jgi:sporulation protein YlmC with PRC-barrel domain
VISLATLNGRLLISNTDGKNLGEVRGVYLDRNVERGIAVFLGKTGLISRKENLIDLKRVRLFGVDAWLLDGSDVVVSKEDFHLGEELILAETLQGREIRTDGGTRIGTVEDVLVDEKFAVLGFSLGKIFVQGPLAEAGAIARGAITSLGDKSSPMIASLEQAEKLVLPKDE